MRVSTARVCGKRARLRGQRSSGETPSIIPEAQSRLRSRASSEKKVRMLASCQTATRRAHQLPDPKRQGDWAASAHPLCPQSLIVTRDALRKCLNLYSILLFRCLELNKTVVKMLTLRRTKSLWACNSRCGSPGFRCRREVCESSKGESGVNGGDGFGPRRGKCPC